jgi:hypothetical protein
MNERASKMWVVTVDENGKETNGHWVDIPAPESFAHDGLSYVEHYVSRLLRSPAPFASVMIATPGGRFAVGLWKRGSVPEIHLNVEWRAEPEREQAIRQFFAGRKLSASCDYLAGNGGVPDATRFLGFYLPSNLQSITSLTKDLLQSVYELSEQDALNFTYQERDLK